MPNTLLSNKYSETEVLGEIVRQGTEEQFRLYRPHPTQLAFHKSRALQRGLFGGNQSGKSFAGCCEIAYTVGKCHPYRPNEIGPVFARECCVNFATIKGVLVKTYRKLLPRGRCDLGWTTYEGKPASWPGLKGGSWKTAWNEMDKTLSLEDGGFIEFRTYEQGREAMQGAQFHIIRHDEEPSESIYEENLARQITFKTNILFTLTPLNYSQWLYERIYQLSAKNEKIDAFMMSVYENPYANVEAIQAMEAACTDPAIRAARLHGEFTFLSGRVYKEYGDHNLVAPFNVPDHWEMTIVIDPHLTKPTYVNLFADDPDTGVTYCIAEGAFGGDVPQVCGQISLMVGKRHVNKWLIDPSANAEHKIYGKGKLINEFRKYIKYLVPANNNRELGWEAVRQAVRQVPGTVGPKFRIFSSCPGTDQQMRNYMWRAPLRSGEDRGKPEVFKRKDDWCDNIRYKMISVHGPSKDSAFTGFNIRMIN